MSQPQVIEKQKVRRDFSFLINYTPTMLTDSIAKYLIEQGEDQVISEYIANPFIAYYSYAVYDYTGKIIERNTVGKMISNKESNLPERTAIMSMKVKERAWFNLCDQPALDIQENSDVSLNRTGRHFQVFLDEIQYRYSQKIEVKRTINIQSRDKGRTFFEQKKYIEAALAYKYIIKIAQARSKKYSEEEICEIETMNLNATRKYLQSMLLVECEPFVATLARFSNRVVERLVTVQPNELNWFYYARWLRKMGKYKQSVEAARKSLEVRESAAVIEFLKQVEELLPRKE